MSHQPNHSGSSPPCWILELIPELGTQGAAPVPKTPNNPRPDQRIPLIPLSASNPPLGKDLHFLATTSSSTSTSHIPWSLEKLFGAFFFIYFQGIRVLLDILLTSCNRFAGLRWQQMASHTRDVKITGWVYSRRFIRDGICKGAALCSHQPCISTTELSSGELINPECPAVESSSSKPSFMPL